MAERKVLPSNRSDSQSQTTDDRSSSQNITAQHSSNDTSAPNPGLRRSSRAPQPTDFYCRSTYMVERTVLPSNRSDSQSQNDDQSCSQGTTVPHSRNGTSAPNPEMGHSPRNNFYYWTLLGGNVMVTQLDQQRGRDDQSGRNFSGSSTENQRLIEEDRKGEEVYYKYLRPNGWGHFAFRFLSEVQSTYVNVFLAKGLSAETADQSVYGVTKFFEFYEIWRKWRDDEGFRRMFLPEEGQAPTITTNTAVVCSVDGENAVARKPVESSTEVMDEEQRSAVPRSQVKRVHSTAAGGSSKKQRNERPIKEEPSSPSRSQAKSPPAKQVLTNSGVETETPTADGGALNPSVLVSPIISDSQQGDQNASANQETTGSNPHDMTDGVRLSAMNDGISELEEQLKEAQVTAYANALRLSEATDSIKELKTQLKDAQGTADANALRLSEANKQVSEWKEKCEQMQAKTNQILGLLSSGK